MAVTMADLFFDLAAARREIAALTERLAETDALRARNRALAEEIRRLRAVAPIVGHEWHRESASAVFRCTVCGTRAYDPRAVQLDCVTAAADRAKWRRTKRPPAQEAHP